MTDTPGLVERLRGAVAWSICGEAADEIERLSSWQPIETLVSASGLIIAGSYNANGQWCCEVAHVDYVREHLAKIASGSFTDSPHLAWEYTNWSPLLPPPLRSLKSSKEA